MLALLVSEGYNSKQARYIRYCFIGERQNFVLHYRVMACANTNKIIEIYEVNPMNNKRTRLIALLLSTVVVASGFAGCGKANTAEDPAAGKPAPTETEKKDSIIIATVAETPSMSPYTHNAVAGSYMNMLTYSNLFITDENLNPVPSLVETAENTSETEWVLKLKPGIKFHDGSALTAEDVAASLDFAKTFTEVVQFTKSVASVEVVDELTLKITTPAPSATLLYDLSSHANAIVPKELIDSGNDFNKNPIGSGPYVFKEWTLGDSVTFEAFADYFEGAPAIKDMTWKIIPEGSSRTIALEAGEVDMVVEVESMDAARLDESEDITLLKHDASQVSWLVLNNEVAPFDNATLRHALNAAVNKESIVTVAVNGLGSAAIAQTPSGIAGESTVGADTYDVAKAKQLLADSGVAPEDVKLSIICSNDEKKRAGEVVQSNLLEIGVTCELENMDLATYLSATISGDFVGSIAGYTTTDMASMLMSVFNSKSINSSNMSRINNPELDALIEKAAVTVDAAEREAVAKQANELLNQLCPTIPLYQNVYLRAFNSKLTGVAVNGSGAMHFDKVAWAE